MALTPAKPLETVAPFPFVYLRIRQVCAVTGLSRSSVYRIPDFPKPVKLGPLITAWRSDEVEQWMLARARQGVSA